MPTDGSSASWNTTQFERVLEAIRDNDGKRLATLLGQCPDIDLNQMKDGTYPINICIGYVECVKVLLAHGAKPDLATQDGVQAIHLAVERDFVETVMQLVLHKADYDVETNDGKTPLQIAIDEKSLACQHFLHFLGAKIPDDKVSSLDEDTRSKYEVTKRGFTDGNIVSGVERINDSSSSTIPVLSREGVEVNIGIQGASDTFVMFVRRLLVDFQSSSIRIPMVPIPEDMELISNIYQYIVDKNVTCNLYIPIADCATRSRYKELLVIQRIHFGQTSEVICDNVDYVGDIGKVVIKGIQLYAHGSSPIVAFGIFSRNKTDTKVIDSTREQTVQSTVENFFEVIVPAGTAQANTEIKLQVIKAESYGGPESNIGSHSDFCSITTQSTHTVGEDDRDIITPTTSVSVNQSSASLTSSLINNDEIFVKLPKPPVERNSSLVVMRCKQGDNGFDSQKWTEEAFDVSKESIECRRAPCGVYIVLVVIKKIAYIVSERVRDMYEFAKGCKQMCKLFAMVKPLEDKSQYLVHVILCHDNNYEERLKHFIQRDFTEQECGPTDTLEIHAKCTYMLKLDLRNAHVIHGPDHLPIQYQGQIPKSQTFQVEIEVGQKPSGQVFSFKREIPKKLENYGTKCKATLAIRFNACKTNTISTDKYLSDHVIENVARHIGDKWFELGIQLGFQGAELFALQDMDPLKRNRMILFMWRDEDRRCAVDKRLDKLVIAARKTPLPRLRVEVLADVIKFRNSNAILDNWIGKYSTQRRSDTEGVTFSFKTLLSEPVSPLGDAFLLLTASRILVEDTMFICLGVTTPELNGCKKISNDNQRRCKLLMLARDKYRDVPSFLRALIKCLSEQKDTKLTINELSNVASNWLKSDSAKVEDGGTIRKLQKIFI